MLMTSCLVLQVPSEIWLMFLSFHWRRWPIPYSKALGLKFLTEFRRYGFSCLLALTSEIFLLCMGHGSQEDVSCESYKERKCLKLHGFCLSHPVSKILGKSWEAYGSLLALFLFLISSHKLQRQKSIDCLFCCMGLAFWHENFVIQTNVP